MRGSGTEQPEEAAGQCVSRGLKLVYAERRSNCGAHVSAQPDGFAGGEADTADAAWPPGRRADELPGITGHPDDDAEQLRRRL